MSNKQEGTGTQILNQTTGQVSASLNAVKNENPDNYAKSMSLAKELNMPVDLVHRNYDKFYNAVNSNANKPQDIAANNPALSQWVTNKDNAAIAKDDLANLQRVDLNARRFATKDPALYEDLYQAFSTGFNDASASLYHTAMNAGTLEHNDDNFNTIAEYNRRSMELRKKTPDYFNEFTKEMSAQENDVNKAFGNFLKSSKKIEEDLTLETLKNFASTGTQTVGESLDYIRSAIVRPKAILYSATQSLAHSALPLVTGFTGAKIGAQSGRVVKNPWVVGAATTTGFVGGQIVGSTMSEYGSWVNQEIANRGYDITNPQDLKKAYSDKKLMADISSEAKRKGFTTALVDATFNMFAGKFLKGGKGFVGKTVALGKEAAVQAVGEATSEFSGQVAAKGIENANLGESLLEGITSFGHTAGELVITAPSEVRAMFKKDTVSAAKQVSQKADQAVEAHASAQKLTELMEAVKESKTLDRSGEAVQELVNMAVADGVGDKIYFQADDWYNKVRQAGLNPQELAGDIMGDNGAAFTEAFRTGGMLQVDVGAFVTKMANHEKTQDIMQIARATENSLSVMEAKDFLAQLPGLMGTLSEEAKTYTRDDTEELQAVESIKQQLLEAGVAQDAAEQKATMLGSFYSTLATELNIPIADVVQKYGATITREDESILGDIDAYEQTGSLKDDLEQLKRYKQKRQVFVDFLRGKGKMVFETQTIRADELRSAGAPPEIMELYKEFMKPENQPPAYVNKVKSFKQAESLPRLDLLGFYSQLEYEVSKLDFKSMPPQQLKAQIKNISGLKPEEIEFVGLNEFLDAFDGPKITKEAVLEFIKGNGLVLEQVVLGDAYRKKDRAVSTRGGGTPHMDELDFSRAEHEDVPDSYIDSEYEYITEQFNDYFPDAVSDAAESSEKRDELTEELTEKFTNEDGEVDEDALEAAVDEAVEALKNDSDFEQEVIDSYSDTIWDMARDNSSENYDWKKIDESQTGHTIRWSRNDGMYEILDDNGSIVKDGTARRWDDAAAQTELYTYLIDEGIVSTQRSVDINNIQYVISDRLLSTNEENLKAKIQELLDAGFNSDITDAHERYRVTSHEVERRFKRGDYNDEEAFFTRVMIAPNELDSEVYVERWGGKEWTLETPNGAEDLTATNFEEAKKEALEFLKNEGFVTGETAETVAALPASEPVPEDTTNKPTALGKFGKYYQVSQQDKIKDLVGETTNYREFLIRMPKLPNYVYRMHWPEYNNIIVHIRTSDKIQDGKKILIVEEIQSDLHQQGRRYGYAGSEQNIEALDNDIEKLENEFKDSLLKVYSDENKIPSGLNRPEKVGIYKLNAQLLTEAITQKPDDVEKLEDKYGMTKEVAQEIMKLPPESEQLANLVVKRKEERDAIDYAPPSAPLKSSESWGALAFKKALALAVSENYDAISIMPGKVHAERWGTDEVSWHKAGDGVWLVGSVEQRGGEAGIDGMTIEEVARQRGQLLESEGTPIRNKDQLFTILKSILGRENSSKTIEAMATKLFERMQKEETGVLQPRKQGLEDFYNNLIPRKAVPEALKRIDKKAKLEVGKVGELEALTLNLTPEMKEKIKGGLPYFQRKDEIVRGAYSTNKGMRRIMLFAQANLSTFLHESGHYFLEVYADLIKDGVATDKIKNDYQTILDWFGVESREQIQVEHHEKFARAFEKYLGEGRAPTSKLRSAFAAFRAWIVSIYKKLANLNVEVSDEIKGVFDRLLATEQELEDAANELNLSPLFSDAKAYGLTDAEAAKYAKAIEDYKEAARANYDAKILKAANRERSEFWKQEKALLKDEILKTQVNNNPVFMAKSILQNGTMPDGSTPAPGLDGIKLNKADLIAQYGKDFVKKLPKPIMYDDNGVNHNLVAEMFGFSSGDEMLTQIMNTPKADVYAEQKADAIMKERYGDKTLDEDALKDEAIKSLHEADADKLLRQEYKMLARNLPLMKGLQKRVALPIPPSAELTAEAERQIADMRVRDLKPYMFTRAEARAAKDAVEKLNKGDVVGAMNAKRSQVMNRALYKAAVKAQEQADKNIKYLKKYLKLDQRKMLGKAGKEYLDQVDSLLERFDFTKGMPLSEIDKRDSLANWIRRQEEQGVEPLIPDNIRNEAFKTSYKNLTMNELKGLNDSVQNIVALARLKNRLLKNQKHKMIEDAVEEMVGSIVDNSKGKRPKQYETRRPEDELKRLGASFLASHLKLNTIGREFDGWSDNGAFWNNIMRPINEAADKKALMIEEATIEMNKIFDVYSPKERKAFSEKVFIPEIQASLSKEAILSVALNWGTQDNRTKLMDGYGWEQAQVEAILNNLDKKDLKFVQDIWDFINRYWPETEKLSQRVDGVAPDKVEASPFTINGVEYKGGYYPLKYDERQSPRAYKHLAEEAAKMAMNGATARATTRHGHRKARVDGVEMPIRLDLGVVFEHVESVAHDLTHYEMLIDVTKLLRSKKLQTAIIEHYGDIYYKEINDAINDIAAGNVPAQQAAEKALNRLRAGVSISAMGWNLMTTLQQPLGLTQSIQTIGAKWVAIGVKRFIGDAARMENTAKYVHEKSSFMKLRHKTQQKEINEIRNTITKSKRMTDLQESFFYLIAKGQLIADIPTWIGAFEKAMATQVDKNQTVEEQEKLAIALADQAVIDSQGGGHIKDLARVQRGSPFMALWTSFYSYFNVTFNRNYEAIKRTNFKKPESIGRLAVDLFIINSLPVVLTSLMVAALKGEDDDPEKLAKKIAQDQLGYLMGQMILMREIGSAMMGYQGYSGPAGARFFSEAGKLAKQAAQGELDEAFVRSLNQVGGIVFQYPATQIDRTARGFDALANGKTENPAVLLFGPPAKK